MEQFFSLFQNSDFLGFQRGVGDVKGQKMTHNYHFQSATLYILGTVDHIIKIVGT